MQNHRRAKFGWVMLALWTVAVLAMILVWTFHHQKAQPQYDGATFVAIRGGFVDV